MILFVMLFYDSILNKFNDIINHYIYIFRSAVASWPSSMF